MLDAIQNVNLIIDTGCWILDAGCWMLISNNLNVALTCIADYEDRRKAVAFTKLMLDARCWSKIPSLAGIFRNALIVKSKNIQYPGTSIQNQPLLAIVIVVTA
jgi:hypothetical protein